MFWNLCSSGLKTGEIVDADQSLVFSYRELANRVALFEGVLSVEKKKLVLLLGDNSVGSLLAYLACLRCGHAVLLLSGATDAKLVQNLLEIYRPEIVMTSLQQNPGFKGYEGKSCPWPGLGFFLQKEEETRQPIAPELAVLLSTSGTTGSPKLIRLSYRNLQSNAASIAEYLKLGPEERPITSLPMSYSYGLSVINSHLHAGGSLICTNTSVVSKEFWTTFQKYQCTSLAGVPFTYHTLEKLRFERMTLPSLRTMTQAGGRLDPAKVKKFGEIAHEKNIRFFVMYGQTEATARISYLPPELLKEKPDSIGLAIPGGELLVHLPETVTSTGKAVGEIHYRGPNVMLGYAETRDCLARGDDLGGLLRTGDIGYRDDKGLFYITGRLKRFIKIFGLRVNLDEVEKMLESDSACPVACGGRDESMHILLETRNPDLPDQAIQKVSALYKIHHTAIKAKAVENLPVLPSGKKDYQILERLF